MPLYKTIVKKVSIPQDKKVKQKNYEEVGQLAVVDQGKDIIGGYSNDFDKRIECDLPVVIFGDHTCTVKYINFPFAAGADGIKILESKDNVVPKYLYYGTKYLTLRFPEKGYARHYQHIEKMDLFLPTVSEQRRIVSRIEELFSKLDKGVETLQTIKQQLAVYRRAVLNKAFHTCEQWPQYAFSDLMCEVRNGYGLKPDDRGKHKILKISAVRPLKLDTSESRLNETPFPAKDTIVENDILFTRYNGSREYVGVCAVVPKLEDVYAYPDKLIKCRPKIQSLDHSKYLAYYMSQGDARKYLRSKIKTTSGQNGIAGTDIKKTVVYMPDLQEQSEIVSNIESKLSICDSIERTVDKTLAQADAMRQSILKQAFEGKL